MKTLKLPEKLVISRKEWLDATTKKRMKVKSVLYDSNIEAMCCLGHLCYAMGVPKKKMHDYGMPDQISRRIKLPTEIVSYLGSNTDWTRDASRMNDYQNDDDSSGNLDCRGFPIRINNRKEREAKLKEHFQKINVKLSFVP